MKIEPHGYITKDGISYCHRCFIGAIDETKVTAITDNDGKHECIVCKEKIDADMPAPKWGTSAYFNTRDIEDMKKDITSLIKSKKKGSGFDINAKDAHGVRPIFHAEHTRRADVIALLIDEGVDISLTKSMGTNSLRRMYQLSLHT